MPSWQQPPTTVPERQARIDAHGHRLRWCVLDSESVTTNYKRHDFIVRFKNLRERGQMRYCVYVHTYYYPAARSMSSITLDSPSMRCVAWEEGIAAAEQLLAENGFLQ